MWVQLRKVPLELMTPQGLGYIASAIGVPVCLEKSAEHISSGTSVKLYAEVDSQCGLPEFVDVQLGEGSISRVEVEYPWKKPMARPVDTRWVKKDLPGSSSAASKGAASENRLDVVDSVPTNLSMEVVSPVVVL